MITPKELITQQKIIRTFEQNAKNKKNWIGIGVLGILGLVLFAISSSFTQPIEETLVRIMGILLIISPIWVWVDTLLVLKKLKQGRYQVVVDHVKKVTLPRHAKQYQQPGYLFFRKHGRIAAANVFRMADPNNENESKLLRYWEDAQIGDPFYLVIVGKRILFIYSCEQYCI